jgi:hypothetical protein
VIGRVSSCATCGALALKLQSLCHSCAVRRQHVVVSSLVAFFRGGHMDDAKKSPDCGDSSCLYAKERKGMRTNGGCRCDMCPVCGGYIRPQARHLAHHSWCTQPEWIPEHHRLDSTR